QISLAPVNPTLRKIVIAGLTGECIFPATSRYCSNGYLINCTDALEFIVGLTGVCKLRKPPKMESLNNCTDACLQASSVQPTLNPSLSFWVHCTDAIIFPIVGSSGALC